MNEGELMSFEVKAEHIPTAEEIRSVFGLFTEKEGVQPDRILEDEKGVYVLEFTVAGDAEGEKTEYGYMRKGRHEKGEISKTSIQATYYDKNGLPFCGDTLAHLINGEWIYTKEGEEAKKKIQQ